MGERQNESEHCVVFSNCPQKGNEEMEEGEREKREDSTAMTTTSRGAFGKNNFLYFRFLYMRHLGVSMGKGCWRLEITKRRYH